MAEGRKASIAVTLLIKNIDYIRDVAQERSMRLGRRVSASEIADEAITLHRNAQTKSPNAASQEEK